MLHIKLKRITNAATWKQIFSLQTPIPQLPSPGNGVSRSNSTFLEHGHVAYQIKWNHEVHQNGNNYLACWPLPHGPWIGSIGQNSFFFHNIAMFKGITKCNNMVANILLADTPSDPRDGSIGLRSTFQNRVLLHIKLKGITKCSNMVANYFASKNHPLPLRPWGIGCKCRN